jgi:hypothetical protein
VEEVAFHGPQRVPGSWAVTNEEGTATWTFLPALPHFSVMIVGEGGIIYRSSAGEPFAADDGEGDLRD